MKFYEPNETSYTNRLIKELLKTIELTDTQNQILQLLLILMLLKYLEKSLKAFQLVFCMRNYLKLEKR